MTALDIIVISLLGAGAVLGFVRGFLQEALSLLVWVLILVAMRLFHGALTDFFLDSIGTEGGAGIAAFVAIFAVIFVAGRWFARTVGRKSRGSFLGPVDRILGLGFGLLQSLAVLTLLFLLVILVHETIYGSEAERPEWMTASHTYPLLNASGEAMSEFLAGRRAGGEDEAQTEDQTADEGTE